MTVDIELDTQPRELEAPTDLAKALERDPDTERFFDGLSYSKKEAQRRVPGLFVDGGSVARLVTGAAVHARVPRSSALSVETATTHYVVTSDADCQA